MIKELNQASQPTVGAGAREKVTTDMYLPSINQQKKEDLCFI